MICKFKLHSAAYNRCLASKFLERKFREGFSHFLQNLHCAKIHKILLFFFQSKQTQFSGNSVSALHNLKHVNVLMLTSEINLDCFRFSQPLLTHYSRAGDRDTHARCRRGQSRETAPARPSFRLRSGLHTKYRRFH